MNEYVIKENEDGNLRIVVVEEGSPKISGEIERWDEKDAAIQSIYWLLQHGYK